MSRSPSTSARHSKLSNRSTDSPSQVSGRQVQWGRTQVDSKDASSSSSSSSEGSSDNINERLRHQIGPLIPESEIEKRFMNRLVAGICTTIIEQALEEVVTIRTINNMSKLEVNLEYVGLEEKYTMAEHDLGLVLCTSDGHLSYDKFRKDLSFLEEVLSSTAANLKRTYYFADLEEIIKNYELTKEEEGTVLIGKQFNKREIQKLRHYISNERRDLNRMIQNVTEELGNCKDQLNDNIVENTIKTAYIKDWEESRQEQNKMILKKQEERLLDTTGKMMAETEKETRVHNEMWTYLEDSLKDLQNEIEQWMTKYDTDLEEKEQKVQEQQIELNQQKEKYEQFLDQFNMRQKQIDAYKAHKQRKRLAAEELERRTKAATRIQSWWRGVMFRKGLGPWRRKKGKGKKGGSAKDSAKKKKK